MPLAAIIALITAAAQAIGPVGDGIQRLAQLAGKAGGGVALTEEELAFLNSERQRLTGDLHDSITAAEQEANAHQT